MFGKNLKYYRLKNNMTMKALADKIGVTNMAISNYESDNRTTLLSWNLIIYFTEVGGEIL